MYYLYSDRFDRDIAHFDTFDREAIHKGITDHLGTFTNDTVSYERDLTKEEAKKFAGRHIIDFYCCHKGIVCKVISRGGKDYYRPLTTAVKNK